jgi:choline kinase
MEYEKRKVLFENLKMLATSEYEEIFRILKRNNESYTENSNGIFFDVMNIKNETYSDMEKFMSFCLKTRQNDIDRQKELEEYRDEIKG